MKIVENLGKARFERKRAYSIAIWLHCDQFQGMTDDKTIKLCFFLFYVNNKRLKRGVWWMRILPRRVIPKELGVLRKHLRTPNINDNSF